MSAYYREMDPWYDYLALPVGPLMLVVQLATLFVPWRRPAGLVITAALALMLVLGSRLGEPGAGANIGAGLLLMWLVGSVMMLAVAFVLPSGRRTTRR